ncbi:nuclear transport factor 2 family protein [Coleofasciculus sp. FACHB-SPT9]|uniref:DUF4440 domain-containing protein n=1 Tax=Cyanophyceae TaxID=3028117 RepID=UPI0016886715|nr:nuclear transport factor 2 family protein [Coleofasciculus sp. FACHB-SPT9]
MENRTIENIENLEEKLRHAMLTSDVSALDELIADDLVFTMHTGLVVNKQFDLEAHRSGMFRFTSLDVSDRQIHPYGDCIVVTLKVKAAGTHSGQAFSETYRFTRVWVQRQNRWQIVAGHVCQVIPGAKA